LDFIFAKRSCSIAASTNSSTILFSSISSGSFKVFSVLDLSVS
jgi:hypothetical protein